MPNFTTDVLSVQQAAKELCRAPRTILQWITDGKLAATKLGPATSAYVIDRAEVDRAKAADAA